MSLSLSGCQSLKYVLFISPTKYIHVAFVVFDKGKAVKNSGEAVRDLHASRKGFCIMLFTSICNLSRGPVVLI